MFGILLRRLMGALALSIGIVLIAWFAYNQIHPTDEFRRHFHSVFQLILPIACLVVGWRWLRYQGKGIEEVTPPDLKCPELESATAKARQTLPVFLAEVEKGVDGAFIKYPMNTPQGLTEHIWAYVHFFKDGSFNVSLANQPVDEKAEADGRRNVPIETVEDWQIMQRDGNIRGAYSLIALFEHRLRNGESLSPKMRKQRAQLLDAG